MPTSLRRALSLALLVAPLALARAELPPLIPRDVLFGNPERASPALSPDGKRLAWVAPDEKGVLQVWVKTLGQEDGKKVTADQKRGIRRFLWAEDDRTLLYLQDADGDENWHLHGVDLPTGNVRDFTPFQGVQAAPLEVSPEVRGRILVTLNLRDRKLFDVHEVDLQSGAVKLVAENPGDVADWLADDRLRVRAAGAQLPDGGREVRVRERGEGAWRKLVAAPFGEQLELVDLTGDGRGLILKSTLGSNTGRVVRMELASGKETVLAQNPEVDADAVLVHPRRHTVQAVDFPAGRRAWTVVDPEVRADFAAIAALAPGDFEVEGRDRADRTWVVAFSEDRGPVRWFAWDRKEKKGTLLFVARPKLLGLTLAEMKAVVVKARDGLSLHSYLTLPPGVPPRDLPLVLFVHGGPWYRDTWGYNPWVQWFANRGYAVLQPNFRGSTGYGKAFLNAANKQWGKAMHQDLVDAVAWAVREGVADPKRVAVMGGSYGGYAALAGAAFTPDLFRCAVDIVGPSNLFTLLASIPPYWETLRADFERRIGNPRTEEALLREASPLFSADKIRIPLLIGQGANDPRVKTAESEQIVAAIEKNGGRATYVLYPDEGHGFARPPNRNDFNARAELFLAGCLGGRAEPFEVERLPGSTAVVKVVGPAPGR